METAETVIENALSAVAQARAFRERALARRAELRQRAEAVTIQPVYILKKYGGRQLSLKLDS